jgi:hypothetical protein
MGTNANRVSSDRQKILDAMSAGRLSDLTSEDLLGALREEGIRTLEELAERFFGTAARRPGARHMPRPIDFERTFEPASAETAKAIAYQPLPVPFFLDGKVHQGKEIEHFNGQELHFVLPSSRNRMLIAVRDKEVLFRPMRERLLETIVLQDWGYTPPPGTPGVGIISPFPGTPGYPSGPPPHKDPYYYQTIQMFTDVDFQGDWLWLAAGYEWPDLTQVARNTFLFWSEDWNDTIASVAGTDCNVTYFWDINFQGRSVTVPGKPEQDPNGGSQDRSIRDLSAWGFKDVTSSVINWGRPSGLGSIGGGIGSLMGGTI